MPVAKKKRPTQTDVAKLQSLVEKYQSFFGELDSFVGFVQDRRAELKAAVVREAEAKEAFQAARNERQELEYAISGAKDSLFRMVEPGAAEFMPLLDRMEPADPELHGVKSSQWRTEPIAALRLSPSATRLLVEADIVAVGQLQDRVLASPADWWSAIEGLTAAVAAAIADGLNDFIYHKESVSDADTAK